MNTFLISLAIGLGAAVLDTIPMIIKKLDWMFVAAAFFMWILVGILTPKINYAPYSWINGIITAFLVLIPHLFLIYRLDKAALPQICITTLVLGAAVGFLSGILVK